MRLLSRLTLPLLLVPVLSLVAATPATSQPDPTARSVRKTTVVIKVTGCEGCTVSPQSAPVYRSGSAYVEGWSGRTRKVRSGTVTLKVPTSRTKGLYLIVDDPNAVSVGAVTIAVARYAGRKAGKRVTSTSAARARKAHHCWAGTSKRKVTFRLTVDQFPATDEYSGEPGYRIRPYLSPSLRTYGKAHRARQGTLGAQDYFFCKGI